MTGIYKIYCKATNKYYIGQSVNIDKRLKTHLNELKNNKHINQRLQEDFNTYGEDFFIFEKIKEVEEEFLNIFEKYYMEYYDCIKNGYNVIPMNTTIKDKYNKNNITEEDTNIFENIEPLEVPLVAGDIYAYELFDRISWATVDASDNETLISDNIEKTIDAINNLTVSRHGQSYEHISNTIELEVRRAFNYLNITYFDYYGLDDIDNFLKNKTFKVIVGVNGNIKHNYLKIKCYK